MGHAEPTLLFRIRQLVFGNRFVAGVRIVGRVTAVEDFGAVWIYGVNPGGLAESGDDLTSAYANFRDWLVKVLFDFAEMADGFEDFRRNAEEFLHATDDGSVAQWRAARQAVRNGRRPQLDLIVGVEPNELDIEFHAEDLTAAVESPSPELNRLPDRPVATLAA